MNWKSFKQEKPLIGQRILIYDKDYEIHYEVVDMKENTLQRLYGFYEELPIHDYYYWCAVPSITKAMKK